MDKKTQKIGVICSIVQIILSIICLIYSAINQENIIMWVLFLCSGILSLSSNISRNNKKEDEWGSANSSLSSWTQKPNTEKLTVDPRRVRTVSGLFYPQNQKSLSQWQKRKPFSPSSDIVHWFEGDFLRKQEDRCSSRMWAVCHTSEFSFPSLLSALFETATTVCCNSALSSV